MSQPRPSAGATSGFGGGGRAVVCPPPDVMRRAECNLKIRGVQRADTPSIAIQHPRTHARAL